MPHSGPSLQNEIIAGIDDRVHAVRAKDVDGLMQFYTDDVVTFDVVAPLVNHGAAAVRKRVSEWFASFSSPIEYDISEVSVHLSDDTAFDHHLTHVKGTSKTGDVIAMWFRETVGYKSIGGRWMIVHQHSSSPFDMETGKPIFDLRP